MVYSIEKHFLQHPSIQKEVTRFLLSSILTSEYKYFGTIGKHQLHFLVKYCAFNLRCDLVCLLLTSDPCLTDSCFFKITGTLNLLSLGGGANPKRLTLKVRTASTSSEQLTPPF